MDKLFYDRILGIDPGASGGIACFDADNGFSVIKTPTTERDVWEHIVSLAFKDGERIGVFAILEQVHSMPKQGVASTFKFGVNYGMLTAFLIAADIPFETVTPAKWQRALGCLSHGDKNVTKQKAQQLFTIKKITHATADALLIAEYGRRLHFNYWPKENA